MADPSNPGSGQPPWRDGYGPEAAPGSMLLVEPEPAWRAPMLLPDPAPPPAPGSPVAAPPPAPGSPVATPPPPAPDSALAFGEQGTAAAVQGAYKRYAHIPARKLDLVQSMEILQDLKTQGALSLSKANILGLSIMDWGVVVNSFKVRKPNPDPASTVELPLTRFDYSTKGTPIDPRMAVLMYRLATYLHVEHDAIGMTTMGLARSHERPELSCHNQGRAVDFKGVIFEDESITVMDHWGSIPLRQDGEVVKAKWNNTTKKFDTGPAVLSYKAIVSFVQHELAKKVRQERLDPAIEVDAILLQSSIGGMADPGPPDTWSEDTKAKAEKIQKTLRRAATVFLGVFDFFVRESTLQEGSLSYTDTVMTEIGGQPISRINSGNLCNPDGSVWEGHQDHFHAQIGPTSWAAAFDSKSKQPVGEIDAGAKKFLYDRTARMVVGLLTEAWGKHKAAADTARAAFEKQRQQGKVPADAVWEEQPGAKPLLRRLAIAGGYTDERIKRRIETFDGDDLPEIGPRDLVKFHTQRGRVLTRWYHQVKGGQEGPPATHWRNSQWLGKLDADTTLTDEAARQRLVDAIDAELTAARIAVVGGG